MAAARCCLSLLLLSTCVALLLQPLLGARGAPLEPLYPGGNATPEQMAQYAAELHRYINMLTKPRHVPWTGRETPAPGTLGSLHFPVPAQLSPPHCWLWPKLAPCSRTGSIKQVKATVYPCVFVDSWCRAAGRAKCMERKGRAGQRQWGKQAVLVNHPECPSVTQLILSTSQRDKL
uniref:Pancreatic polypeptide n=1 Tax=Theropithecus gelada TaxID=9565 RepID=A0A8D2EQ15_THEGE